VECEYRNELGASVFSCWLVLLGVQILRERKKKREKETIRKIGPREKREAHREKKKETKRIYELEDNIPRAKSHIRYP